MGMFDFLQKLQNKSNELQKKAEVIKEQIENNPIVTLSKILKPDTQNPDVLVDGVSKQILKQRDSLLKNGFKEYEFMANHDCCSICASLNGKHFPIDNLKIGVNAPPMHDGCKCSISAWEDEEEYEAWLDFLEKGGSTAEWEKAKKRKK